MFFRTCFYPCTILVFVGFVGSVSMHAASASNRDFAPVPAMCADDSAGKIIDPTNGILAENGIFEGSVDLLPPGHRTVVGISPQPKVAIAGVRNLDKDLWLADLERSVRRPVGTLEVVDRRLVIKNAVIRGDVILKMASRTDGTVSVPVLVERLRITDSVICGSLLIEGARLLSGANFHGTRILNGARITHAYSRDSLIFSNAGFGGDGLLLFESRIDGQLNLRCLEAIDPAEPPNLGIRNSVLDGDLVLRRDGRCEQPDGRLANVRFGGTWFKSGRFRFESERVTGSLSANRTVFDTRPHFTDVDVVGDVSFNNARFNDGARFFGADGITWRDADFTHARFGKSPLILDGLQIPRSLDFQSAEFEGPVEIRAAKFGYLNFAGARFGAYLAADLGELGAVSFHGIRAAGPVRLSGMKVGPHAMCRDDDNSVLDTPLTFDLGRATFVSGLAVRDLSIDGQINMSHISVAPANLELEWSVIFSRVRSVNTASAVDGRCTTGRRIELVKSGDPPMGEERLYRLLHASLTGRDRLGSNDAFFLSEQARNRPDGKVDAFAHLSDPRADAAIGAFLSACAEMRFQECLWGYGVRPLRPLFWLVLVTALLAAVLRMSPIGVFRAGSGPEFGFSLLRMPFAEQQPPFCWWERDADDKSQHAGAVAHLFVALNVLTGLSVDMSRIDQSDMNAVRTWILWMTRTVGLVLLWAFLVSLGRAVPLVSDFLKFVSPL